MLMLFAGGLLVLDKYGNSLDDGEDRDAVTATSITVAKVIFTSTELFSKLNG